MFLLKYDLKHDQSFIQLLKEDLKKSIKHVK